MIARQHGVALITALLVVAIASVAAVAMTTRQQLDIRRTGNLLHSEQAWAYVLGAEAWARVVLARDANESQIDTLKEDWATRPPASIVEGGYIVGRIIDLQGRFNVNSLVQGGKADEAAITQYKRLLRRLELEETLADPLVDWIDANLDERFPDGAEDNSYLLLNPPYRAANRPLADITELRLVKGYSAEVLSKLLPYVTALPQPTAINVNTASAEVLSTVADGLSLADGESLLEARGEDGFASVDNFLKEAVLAGKNVDADMLTVSSQWFLMVSEANVGRGRARLASLIQRDTKGTRVISRRREFTETVEVAVDEGAANDATGEGG
ncbi:MAG TPA: general secretion pathway protein GspK [Gammaproteobacteria bacterium]|nr:general secretion pathway protein GspK [Gammaproteobacteria bacterium]